MHLILYILCVVSVEPVVVYKDCPVSCTCSHDEYMPKALALEANRCFGVQEMPGLTPNITVYLNM